MKCSFGKRARAGTGRGRRRALTLLEVMVAMAIASAGFAAVAGGLVQAQRARLRSTQAEAELALARALTEEAYLGLMPEEQADRTDPGVRRWTGLREGLAWEVKISLQAVKGLQAARAGEAAGPAPGGLNTPMLAMDVIETSVGRVELMTVRW